MQFGLYLVEKGTISAMQFVKALRKQHSELVPVGELAVERGFLTTRQVFAVLRLQTSLPPEPFGETAVRQGVLTRNQLAELLMDQSDRKRALSEILIEQEVLSQQECEVELAAFRRSLERNGARKNSLAGV